MCSNVSVEGQCHLCCCAERGEDLQALRRRRGAAQVVKPPSAPSCSPVVPESQRLEPSPVLQSPELQTRPFRRTYARSPCVLTPLFGIGVVPLTHVIGSVPAVAKQPLCTSVVGLCGKGWPGQSSRRGRRGEVCQVISFFFPVYHFLGPMALRLLREINKFS